MEKVTSKAAIIFVFFVIASCVPLFSKAEAVPNIDQNDGQIGTCSNQNDCDKINYQCPWGKLLCADGECRCPRRQLNQINKCSNQTDCDKINYLCPSGKLSCVDGQCKCVGYLLPNEIGKCSKQKDCDKINYLCTSGKLQCVDGQCKCVNFP
ncbi:hypothetical protein ACFX2K_021002 [Malus domestica]